MKAPFVEKTIVTCKPGICRHQRSERIGPRINCWEGYRAPVECDFCGNDVSYHRYESEKLFDYGLTGVPFMVCFTVIILGIILMAVV